MRNVFLIVVLFISVSGFCQPIVKRSNNTKVIAEPQFGKRVTVKVPTFKDTTEAKKKIKLENGTLIFTTDEMVLWLWHKNYWYLLSFATRVPPEPILDEDKYEIKINLH